jgi:hypothetical protein
MENRIEIRIIETLLWPIKAVLWVLVVIFGPALKIRVVEDEDKIGYYVDECPTGMCPHFPEGTGRRKK